MPVEEVQNGLGHLLRDRRVEVEVVVAGKLQGFVPLDQFCAELGQACGFWPGPQHSLVGPDIQNGALDRPQHGLHIRPGQLDHRACEQPWVLTPSYPLILFSGVGLPAEI